MDKNKNKLKEQMNNEIDRAVNKYNSAVFILNGGTTTEAKIKYGSNGPRLPAESLRRMCASVDANSYNELKRTAKWCTPEYIAQHGSYLGEPSLLILRKNKHLFIGESE